MVGLGGEMTSDAIWHVGGMWFDQWLEGGKAVSGRNHGSASTSKTAGRMSGI